MKNVSEFKNKPEIEEKLKSILINIFKNGIYDNDIEPFIENILKILGINIFSDEHFYTLDEITTKELKKMILNKKVSNTYLGTYIAHNLGEKLIHDINDDSINILKNLSNYYSNPDNNSKPYYKIITDIFSKRCNGFNNEKTIELVDLLKLYKNTIQVGYILAFIHDFFPDINLDITELQIPIKKLNDILLYKMALRESALSIAIYSEENDFILKDKNPPYEFKRGLKNMLTDEKNILRVELLKYINENRNITFSGSESNITISPEIFILYYNIVKNAFSLYERKVYNKQFRDSNRQKYGVSGIFTSVDIDFILPIKKQLELTPLNVNVSILEDRYIVVEDSGMGLDLSKLRDNARKIDPNVSGISEELSEALSLWIGGDFSKDRIIRANLDEIIFILGQSTNNTSGIGLSIAKYLKETKQCDTYVYDKGNEPGVVFIIDLKKGIDDTRESIGHEVVQLLKLVA